MSTEAARRIFEASNIPQGTTPQIIGSGKVPRGRLTHLEGDWYAAHHEDEQTMIRSMLDGAEEMTFTPGHDRGDEGRAALNRYHDRQATT